MKSIETVTKNAAAFGLLAISPMRVFGYEMMAAVTRLGTTIAWSYDKDSFYPGGECILLSIRKGKYRGDRIAQGFVEFLIEDLGEPDAKEVDEGGTLLYWAWKL